MNWVIDLYALGSIAFIAALIAIIFHVRKLDYGKEGKENTKPLELDVESFLNSEGETSEQQVDSRTEARIEPPVRPLSQRWPAQSIEASCHSEGRSGPGIGPAG